jgi:hypothetical protein
MAGPSKSFFAVLLLALAAPGAPVTAATADDRALASLQNPDPDQRVEALRSLMTSTDPRIPNAILPLLRDEGNSIRRLAARAVGSRWREIPPAKRDEFLAALQRNAKSEFDDERNMVQRGLGLLRRDYRGSMFARSPDKRWVVYERFNLPCIIDTSDESEELLGWSPERNGYFASSWGNGETAPCVHWHPSSDMVALDMLINRKANAIGIWGPGQPLRIISPDDVVASVGPVEGEVMRSGGIYFDTPGWDGRNLHINANFSTMKDENITDWNATLSWDPETDRLTVLAKSRVP